MTHENKPIHFAARRTNERREISERVSLQGSEMSLTAWTLNTSEGGLRLVLEGDLAVGAELDLVRGETSRRVRIVWTQNERDGQIVGVQYVEVAR